MLTHPFGPTVTPVRIGVAVSAEALIERERQRLRQELLRRILDRESRRRSLRSATR
jgi:hypothetical protein